jgi:hypothetical protein
MIGFIATAQFEDTIYYYGESDTPEKALDDFISNGEFKEHCVSIEADIEDDVEIGIFEAIYKNSPHWSEDFDQDWEFALGQRVATKLIGVES